MDALFARLKEPSTYAGLAVVALAIAQGFPHVAGAASGMAVMFGSMAAAMGEKTT